MVVPSTDMRTDQRMFTAREGIRFSPMSVYKSGVSPSWLYTQAMPRVLNVMRRRYHAA
jgi:hypothetical protein